MEYCIVNQIVSLYNFSALDILPSAHLINKELTAGKNNIASTMPPPK